MSFLGLAAMLLARGADGATTMDTKDLPPTLVRTSQLDHQALKELLRITASRPGRNGINPQATNYANYDESRANPFPNLPDPPLLKKGWKITTPAVWWTSGGRKSWRISTVKSMAGSPRTLPL